MATKPLCILFLLVLSLTAEAQTPPVANFSGTPLSGCAPLVVNFTDQSSGSPKFWNWDFGNGQLSNLQNPTVSFNLPGTYSVTLVVRNADGTNGVTKTNYITVNPSPTVGFTSNINSGCVPSVVQFTDQSSTPVGSITKWEWNFGDGTTSTQQHPSHIYNTPGFYTVSLKVTSSTGCVASTSSFRHVRIVSGVTADFTFPQPATCRPPFNITFKNETSGPGTLTYAWNLGNGNTSTNTNPATIYNAAGNYTVSLIAQSSFGCGDTIQKVVTINGTNTNFNAPDSACINTTVNFQNLSPAALSTLWTFGDGDSATTVNTSHVYTSAGNYSVKLLSRYQNCTDSVIKAIEIVTRPTVDFTAPNVIACKAPFTVNFQDISPNAVTWLWNFGDGTTSTQKNPVKQYNTAGEFDVRLTITDRFGCQNTVTKTKFVRIIPPTVAISNAPIGGCVPFTYSPLANVNAIDGVASYFWDFGDGGATSTAPNPSHTYTTPGAYTIKLVITTVGGCRDSIVVVNGVRTGTLPSVNFTADTLVQCAYGPVKFTSLATPADQWLWRFGDGGTSILQNPVYNYTDTGSFAVTLTAWNNGCANSMIKAAYINVRPPIAKFSTAVNCSNNVTVIFTNESKVNPAYGAVSYLWQFGDPANSTSTAVNPTFSYPTIGTYTVRLTVTNGPCTHTISIPITLSNELADFSISKNPVCRDEVFTLTATGSNAQNIVNYTWTIGSGPFSGPRSTNSSLGINGTYDVSLTITDKNGCTDTKTVSNYITVIGPTANFGVASPGGCKNSTITFIDSSSSAIGIANWTYDFGDGKTQAFTAPPFTHLYTDTGTFTVKLTVRDVSGCTHTKTLANAVKITQPLSRFGTDTTLFCQGMPMQFKDSSAGIIINHFWNFGDGGTSTLKNPTHIYTGPDSVYTVKLRVRDDVGCEDSLTRTNYIRIKRPKPAFDIKDTTTICPPLETKFTFKGQDYEDFYWDFGDGDPISQLKNPTHFYNAFGTYTPKLVLVGYGGCLDSVSRNVIVSNPNSTIINYSPLQACNRLTVNFDVTPPPFTKFIFHFGDGRYDDSQNRTFSHFYSSPAFYGPHLTLIDSTGCQASVGGANTVKVLGAQPLFGVDKKSFCDTGRVFFTNYSLPRDSIATLNWDFGDNTSSTVYDPVHDYTQPGTYIAKLQVSTLSGCTDSITDTIRVYRKPAAVIGSNDTICLNTPVSITGDLIVPDTASVQWSWNFGNGQTSTLKNPQATYNSSGSYLIKLDTKIPFGCSDTTSKKVYVAPVPTVNVTTNPIIISGGSVILPITYTGNPVIYNWTPPSRLSCTDCPNPLANPAKTTTYKVSIMDKFGCINSGEITVTVTCGDKNIFIPNTFSPNGDGINDNFFPRGTGVVRVKSLRIYNRWGETVFDKTNFVANDAYSGWDGTVKGKKASTDVYVYSIEIICENSEIITSRGNIMLLR